ncbi:hypothetical protein ACPCC5_10000 [Streptomyces pseudogriseolus]|uniref:hypothetical protein n=1 Tax=Streptomyces pseudogriseolus TaxID=36817 RepID=UPI003470B354
MHVYDGDYVKADTEWEELCWIRERTDAPKGCRVEITSKATASRDRTAKPAACAMGSVPLYLLIDGRAPGGPAFTLHGAPENGVYRVLESGRFGEPIKLPAPFDLVIDTGEFPQS